MKSLSVRSAAVTFRRGVSLVLDVDSLFFDVTSFFGVSFFFGDELPSFGDTLPFSDDPLPPFSEDTPPPFGDDSHPSEETTSFLSTTPPILSVSVEQ